MKDFSVTIPSFETFLAESDTASLSHEGHSIKNGDQTGDKLKAESDKGSTNADVVEKSANAAAGDDTGCKLDNFPAS